MAGCIIGKGGKNIQKIRTDSGCHVRLPDCSAPERILNITGKLHRVCSNGNVVFLSSNNRGSMRIKYTTRQLLSHKRVNKIFESMGGRLHYSSMNVAVT